MSPPPPIPPPDNRRPCERTILVVDDSEADVELVRFAIEEAGVRARVEWASDGASALVRLNAGLAGRAPMPSLVLLDLNMPRMPGLETLKRIREEPRLRRLPVVVHSTSQEMDDRNASLALGADDYWVKPPRFSDLVQTVAGLRRLFGGSATVNA